MDRSSTPKRIGSSGEVSPRFGPEGQVVFQWSDGRANYLLSMNKDGSGRAKASDEPIGELFGVSPDRRIAVVGRASPDVHTAAVTIGGTVKRKICKGYCPVAWDPSGKFLYVGVQPNSSVATGKTAVIPIPAQESLPELPEHGLDGLESARSLHGVQFVDGYEISPGPSPDVFAYMKQTVHRNLMQVRLPD